MTGKEWPPNVTRVVVFYRHDDGWQRYVEYKPSEVVVLTREEAEAMEQAFLTGGGRLHGELLSIPQALALLSPDEAGDE